MSRWLFAFLAAVALFTGAGLSLNSPQPDASALALSEWVPAPQQGGDQGDSTQTASASSSETNTDAQSEHDGGPLLPSWAPRTVALVLTAPPRCPRQVALISPWLAGPLRPPRA